MSRKNRNRRRSIKTPLPAAKVTPAKRERENIGPTEHTMRRKAELLGVTLQEAATILDPTAAADVLGALAYHKLITTREHRAGRMYSAYRRILYGPAEARAARWDDLVSEHLGGDAPPLLTSEEAEERLLRRKAMLTVAEVELRLCGREVAAAVRTVVIEDRRASPDRVQRGLRAIVRAWTRMGYF